MGALLLVSIGCPSTEERLLQEGHQHARESRWPEALSAYRRAAERAPQSPRAQALVGLAHLELKSPTEAEAAFAAALALDRGEALARRGMAGLAVGALDAGAALAWLEGVPVDGAALIRARALLLRGAAGDAAQALELIGQQRALHADDLESGYLEGCAALALSRYADAQRSFEAVERAHRESPLGPYGLARLAAVQRRATDALLYLKSARALSGPRWDGRAVAADPAFAFLATEAAFLEVVSP